MGVMLSVTRVREGDESISMVELSLYTSSVLIYII